MQLFQKMHEPTQNNSFADAVNFFQFKKSTSDTCFALPSENPFSSGGRKRRFDLSSTRQRTFTHSVYIVPRDRARRVQEHRECHRYSKITVASQFLQKQFPVCGRSQIRVETALFPSAPYQFSQLFSSLWTVVPYIFPARPRLAGKSVRKRKRISGPRDPSRRERTGETSKKCGQIVSPRCTDRCKEIISVSKPYEPFDRSFQPFSPSVSIQRFAPDIVPRLFLHPFLSSRALYKTSSALKWSRARGNAGQPKISSYLSTFF